MAEDINATQAAIARILHKMEAADSEFCNTVKRMGHNYFTEFTREYFGMYMKPIKTPDGDVILEPSPVTDVGEEWGTMRIKIPDTVSVKGIDFTKSEVETCIRLSNVHLE